MLWPSDLSHLPPITHYPTRARHSLRRSKSRSENDPDPNPTPINGAVLSDTGGGGVLGVGDGVKVGNREEVSLNSVFSIHPRAVLSWAQSLHAF